MRMKSAHDNSPLQKRPGRPSAKTPVNLSIDGQLLTAAREARINLSAALEGRLRELLREDARNRWVAENRAAIDAYNERIERDGIFGEEYRRF
jgi:antitoxin CcdA